MSDLQCAASFVVVGHGEVRHDGALSDLGHGQCRALAESLAGRRIALVYTVDASAAVQSAETMAGVLGVPVRVLEGLRVDEELDSLADLHRGETLLVVVAERVLCDTPPVELRADADGWVCTS